MNARHIKRMVNDDGGGIAYRMLDADNEASSEELGSDSEEDVDELADEVPANLTMDQSMYRPSGFTMRHAGGSYIIKSSMKGGASHRGTHTTTGYEAGRYSIQNPNANDLSYDHDNSKYG
jgi:hypothetical protein